MSHLAQMVRRASNAVAERVSMEELLEAATNDNVSMEQLFDEQEQLLALHDGLTATVISFEGLSEPTDHDYQNVRAQIGSQLRMVGMSAGDAAEIVPSMEDRSSAWENFKAFLERLWKMITELAKKVWAFITTALKRSTEGEKLAMARLNFLLKRGLPLARDGMSVNPTIQLTPAHLYLFAPPSMEVAQGPNRGADKVTTIWRRAPLLADAEQMVANVAAFVKARDAFEISYVNHIHAQVDKVIAALKQGNSISTNDLTGTVAIQSTIADAVRELSPDAMVRAMGGAKNPIPLVYDRALLVEGTPAMAVRWDNPAAVTEYMNSLGVDVVQVNTHIDPEKLGTFPAMRWRELATAVNRAINLIDTAHSADQRKRWNQLQDRIELLESHTSAMRAVAKRLDNVEPNIALIFEMAFRFYQNALKWATAPYRKMGALNIMVVNSLIAMVQSQLNNYQDAQGFQRPDGSVGSADTAGWR